MKSYYLYICILTLFFSCNKNICKEHTTNQYFPQNFQIDSLPIGFNALLNINFPSYWENSPINDLDENFSLDKISLTDYNSLIYFINEYYYTFNNELIINKKQKLNFTPKINEKIDNDTIFYNIDSAYYCKKITINDFNIELYKSGNKYKNTGENNSIVDYIILTTTDNKNNIIDYKTIYYHEHNLIENSHRYFYLDKELNLTLYDFESDELNTSFKGKYSYKINKKTKKIEVVK